MATTIAFTGGGTLGHVYPGLSVLEYIKDASPENNQEHDFFWIGSKIGLEYDAVTKASIPFYSIPSGKLRRYFSFKNFFDLFCICAGFIAALFILLMKRPSVVFSKGGYVSVPPVWAAGMLKIPVVSHESDFNPGLATRLNSRFSSRICVGYKETQQGISEKFRSRVVVTGNPVRKEVFSVEPERGLNALSLTKDEREKPVIMVIGGSQGALAINNLITRNIEWLVEKYTIIHQTGITHAGNYSRSNAYIPKGFFSDEHLDLIAAASLVIGRAGASNIWECACIGTPMLLIPLPSSSSRGDQILNARYFEQAGAAKIMYENESDQFIKILTSIMDTASVLKNMSEAAKRIGGNNAAGKIGDLLIEISRGGLS